MAPDAGTACLTSCAAAIGTRLAVADDPIDRDLSTGLTQHRGKSVPHLSLAGWMVQRGRGTKPPSERSTPPRRVGGAEKLGEVGRLYVADRAVRFHPCCSRTSHAVSRVR